MSTFKKHPVKKSVKPKPVKKLKQPQQLYIGYNKNDMYDVVGIGSREQVEESILKTADNEPDIVWVMAKVVPEAISEKAQIKWNPIN